MIVFMCVIGAILVISVTCLALGVIPAQIVFIHREPIGKDE
jgi:hypothetical protein